jgi:tripartite-type tricarboxylate transporter receptor subunit TctC
MLTLKHSGLLLGTVGLIVVAGFCTAADDYPSKTVRIVVAYAPGGGNDLIARVLSKRLSETLGKTVFVDNRPGATGIIGTEMVAKSAPDGYTLILADTPHVTNPYVYPNVQYDPIKDFEAISLVGSAPVVLAVYAKAPFQTLADFIAAAKSQPAKITMASGGTGTTSHFSGELFQMRTSIKLIHVPYKGNGPALADAVAGQIQCIFSPVAAAVPLVTSGRLRALAISSPKRAASMPDVPTFDEAGIPDYRVANWYGVLGPAGIPKPVVSLLNKEIAAAVQSSEVKSRLDASLVDAGTSSPEEFVSFLKAETARWSQVIKTVGIKVE